MADLSWSVPLSGKTFTLGEGLTLCHPSFSNRHALNPQQGANDVFIAMNRFRIAEGREEDFEGIWRNRQSHLEDVAGFREFHLLRSATTEGATLFASHSVWESREAFEAWTNSEAFRKAHAQARAPEGTYLGHPVFEGFEVVL